MTTPPVYQTATTKTGNFMTGSQTIAAPSSGANAANDIFLMGVYKESAGQTVTSTGFRDMADSSGNFTEYAASNHSLYVGWFRLTGTVTGNITVGVGASNSWTEILCARVTGAITSGNPWDVTPIGTASGANVSASPNVALTTLTANTLLMHMATSVTGGAWSRSDGMTERVDVGGDMTLGTVAQAAAGFTGNKTATCSGAAARMIGFLAALLPIPDVGPSPRQSSQFLTFF